MEKVTLIQSVKDENKAQCRISDKDFPQVVVTCVHFLGDEFQIEQGTGREPCDLLNFSNDVVSISKEQAVALARTILHFAGEL